MKFSKLPKGVTLLAANKIVQVLNVFETGSKLGKYDTIALHADFTLNNQKYVQITYGKSQTTEFGNLKTLLQMYVDAKGMYAAAFKPYLGNIGKIVGGVPQSLQANVAFKQLLKKAAIDDQMMRDTQDGFFDRYYFQPAVAFFSYHKFTTPLALLVIYDSFIHSGGIPDFLRQRFTEAPPLMGGDEKKWVQQYVNTRQLWLQQHPNKILNNTVYRTETFKKLITDNNWDLTKKMTVQGVGFL
jgi:chitosanase